MALSTYQIERFLHRLRRFRGWISAVRSGPKSTHGVAGVREPKTYPSTVEAERERRAGSFMTPPYPEAPASRPIPRVRRKQEGENTKEDASR